MSRRVLIPPAFSRLPPMGGGRLAWPVLDFAGESMGTHWRARVVTPPTARRDDIERVIVDALAFVVARMSPWEPDSDLGRFRVAAPGDWTVFAPETLHVLVRAMDVAALSRGRYDPTIGRLTDVLGFGPSDVASGMTLGSSSAVEARAVTDHGCLKIDLAAGAVRQPGGFQLDLCSIAKGYAVDLVIERLQACGVDACFVEIGGEARGLGCKPDSQPWWCAIAPPRTLGHGLPPTVVAACDLSLATSGNTLRRRVLADGEIGHILDPKAEALLDPRLESVTVLAAKCMDADVWATALFLLGAEGGAELAREQGLAALFVERDADGAYRERWSPCWSEYLG